MVLDVKYNGSWFSLVRFMSNEVVQGSLEDVIGSNERMSLIGKPMMDTINQKYVLTFVSRYLSPEEENAVRGALRSRRLDVRTDYFEGAVNVYDGYRSAVAKAQITDNAAKLSVTIDCYK